MYRMSCLYFAWKLNETIFYVLQYKKKIISVLSNASHLRILNWVKRKIIPSCFKKVISNTIVKQKPLSNKYKTYNDLVTTYMEKLTKINSLMVLPTAYKKYINSIYLHFLKSHLGFQHVKFLHSNLVLYSNLQCLTRSYL